MRLILFGRVNLRPFVALFFAVLFCKLANAQQNSITAAECLALVAEHNPEIRAASRSTDAARLRIRQAARPHNPQLTAELENAAGSGEYGSLDAAESSLVLSQTIETGGKRHHRTRSAAAEADKVGAEQLILSRLKMLEARQAIVTLVAAQEKTRLAQEALDLSRETEAAIEVLDRAGKATALDIERTRTETAIALNELELQKAEQRGAVLALAILWGETEPRFETLEAAEELQNQPLRPLDVLLEEAEEHPVRIQAAAQLSVRQAEVAMERAERYPDVELSLGMRRFEENGDYAVVAGIGFELPFFNRNRDGIRAAVAETESAGYSFVNTRLQHEGQIRAIYHRCQALEKQVRGLEDSILPAADRSLALVTEAYRQGKATYLDVLETRHTLLDAKRKAIDTARELSSLVLELNEASNNHDFERN